MTEADRRSQDSSKEDRQAAATDWIAAVTDCTGIALMPVAGDASFRRYFRVNCNGQSYMLMDSPPEKEDPAIFSTITELLERHHIRVPHIHYADLKRGFLLLDDLGDRLYLNEIDEANADRLYRKAIETLLEIQTAETEGLPCFSPALLLEEMNLFTDWYCGRHLSVRLSQVQTEIIQTAFSKLIDNAIEQPQTFVHRDYHSRNLLLVDPAQDVGVLDYQDAVHGPLSYDLVSLLKDCYVRWPKQRVLDWTDYFLDCYRKRSDAGFSDTQFKRWFSLMGVQRHLKASGIFARLCHRDDKPGYIKDIPTTLGYITDCLADYPDYADFRDILINLPPAR